MEREDRVGVYLLNVEYILNYLDVKFRKLSYLYLPTLSILKVLSEWVVYHKYVFVFSSSLFVFY